jgi:hypothetical protein
MTLWRPEKTKCWQHTTHTHTKHGQHGAVQELTVAHLVECHAANVRGHEREKVLAVPLGAQVDDGVGEEAVVGERLYCEAEVVRERGLEESEALGWVGVQIAHRDGTTLQHKPQPSSVRVW